MFKRAKTKTWAAGLIFALSGILTGGAWAGISDTKHNLSSTHTATGQVVYSSNQTEICIFCHTPHDAIKNDNIPLWNHKLSTYAGNYGVYTSPTFDASVAKGGDIADVGGSNTALTATATSLCLSCHDGTVAINSFNNPSNVSPLPIMVGTKAGGEMPDNVAGAFNANLGTDLTNDHPVNFTYNDTLATADGSLKLPATLTGVKLYSNKVQCASCHDPHTSTQGAFLRVSMTGSALCFACHSK